MYFYCFMPNHIHMIIEPAHFNVMPKFMHGLALSYAKYYRRQYEGDGHVWTGTYKSKNIEKDSYLQQCGLYIEANPVRAGIVKNPEDYPWSSARAHICKIADPLVDPCPYLEPSL